MTSQEFNKAMEEIGCPVRAKPGGSHEHTFALVLVWLAQRVAEIEKRLPSA